MVSRDNWKIKPGSSAFVTIDLQRTFLDPDSHLAVPGASLFVPRVNELASICRRLGIPVVHVYTEVRPDLSDAGLKHEIRPRTDSEWECVEGRKGVEFYKDLEIKESDYLVKKIRYSAFIPGSSSIEPLLRGLGRDSIIICGVATPVCVFTTAADAMMLGFKVFFVGDITGTHREEWQRVILEVVDRRFGQVTTFEKVRQELDRLVS